MFSFLKLKIKLFAIAMFARNTAALFNGKQLTGLERDYSASSNNGGRGNRLKESPLALYFGQEWSL